VRVLAGAALLTNALLPITFFAMAVARRSGGDEGTWAVMLFHPLVIAAPVLSIVVIAPQMRRQRRSAREPH
jgi:hypothetical protein